MPYKRLQSSLRDDFKIGVILGKMGFGASKLNPAKAVDAEDARFGSATNNTEFSTTGIQRMNGSATTREDENFDPTALTGGGTLPAYRTFASTTTHIAGFSPSQIDEVELCKEYPHKAKLNNAGETTVKLSFHAHTYAESATVGNVKLGLEYFFTKEGVAVTTSTIVYVTYTTNGIAWAKQSVNFPDITAPEELGSQFHARFFRAGNDVADTYPDYIDISTIGFHYEIDSTGSDQPLVK